MKAAAIGNVEIRDPVLGTVARFNTLKQAARACVVGAFKDVQLWECTKGGKRAGWELVADFTTTH